MECAGCGEADPQTIYGTPALSECCGQMLCDECLINHLSVNHPHLNVQDNPDVARRIAEWTE